MTVKMVETVETAAVTVEMVETAVTVEMDETVETSVTA